MNISRWLLVPLGAVGIALIVYGSLPYIKTASSWIWALVVLGVVIYVLLWNRRRALTTLRRLKWRLPVQWPITFTNKPSPSLAIAEPTLIPIVPPLGYEQIAKNVAFLQALKAVSKRLATNTLGNSYLYSLTSCLTMLSNHPEVQNWRETDTPLEMLIGSMHWRLNQLMTDTSTFSTWVDKLSATSLIGDDVATACRRTREFVWEYGRMVDGIVQLMMALEKRRVPSLASSPISELIPAETRRDYDDLMSLVKALRSHTEGGYENSLPTDDQITKFPKR